MIRFHVTDRALANVRVNPVAPALESLAGAATALTTPGWRPVALAGVDVTRFARPVTPGVGRALQALALPISPEFLLDRRPDLQSALDVLLTMPSLRLADDLAESAERGGPLPEWMDDLPSNRHGIRADLAQALWHLHETVTRPGEFISASWVRAERHRLVGLLAGVGTEGFLDRLHPQLRWRRPVLEFHPVMFGRGRDYDVESPRCAGVQVSVSAWFASPSVTLLGATDDHAVLLLITLPARRPRVVAPDPRRSSVALGQLVGTTRQRVLAHVAAHPGSSTTQIAAALGIAASTASEHLAVLRGAGLVVTRRDGQRAAHHATALGEALLRGTT